MDRSDVYGSGLNFDDWCALHRVMFPFIDAKEPAKVEIPEAPPHLRKHPLVELIRKYRETGDDAFLDKAGRLLIPTDKPFGWFLGLTK